ncbi:MAG: hypothetical protein HOW73_13475 [Polyangiaceae bacterium]|nr:hypothetical protein [Polyangiaceae bacterium]
MKTSAVVLLATACLAGCGNTSTTSGTTSATATGTVSAAPSATGAIGVAECDEYITRVRACIATAPAEEREQRTKSVDDIEKTWKSQAASAVSREQMLTACKSSLKALDEGPGCKAASSASSAAPSASAP